jgi:hypothetical protein
MKKLLLVLTVVFLINPVFSQEKTKQQEVGLAFYNFNAFGIVYKTGTNKSLWRFSTLVANGRNEKQTIDTTPNNNSSLGFRIQFGREYRKAISDQFEFRYGTDLFYGFSYSAEEQNSSTMSSRDFSLKTTRHTFGINLVLGFNYIIKKHIVIGAEMLPYLSYLHMKRVYDSTISGEITDTTKGFSWGFTNQSVLISLAYRF